MGGRGSDSKLGNRQMNLEEYEFNNKIAEIVGAAEMERQRMEGVGAKKDFPPLKKCACCELFTIPVNEVHWECEKCGWIDDEYQNTHPDSLNGPNPICLNEAKGRYFMLGNRE